MNLVATKTTARTSLRSIRTALLCAFFVSGVSGLVHEIAWTRLLRHVMGNTTFTIATVLCVFMGGLALGSYVGGRIIDQRKYPLRAFAWLEAIIGLYCLLLPWMIDASEPIYRFLYQNTHSSFYLLSVLRFVFCSLLLLVPATFMGATLPVLTRFFVQSLDRVGWTVGRLYAINTFGAVVGASATGFVLLPNLGLVKTIYLACALNFAVSGVSLWLHRQVLAWPSGPQQLPDATRVRRRRGRDAKVDNELPSPRGGGGMAVLLVGYGLSGFAAMVYEIAWTRVLSLLIGSSVYAFSMMLTAFILGLAMGSMIYARFVDRVADTMRAMAAIQVVIAFSALLVVPLFGQLPLQVTAMIAQVGASFWLLQFVEFGLILLIMLIPTTAMGAAFPLACRIFVQNSETVGRSVGTLYACNTVGSILGSFAGGFLLIPLVGVQHALLTAVLINAATGCLFLAVCDRLPASRRRLVTGVAFGGFAILVAIIPAWDPLDLTFGPFIQARRLTSEAISSESELQKIAHRPRVIFHQEDYATTVTVKEYPNGVRVICVNAKPDASSTGDLPTQELLAHVPLLLHPEPKQVLVIGLASGITLGSAGLHPVKTLECAEISPAMVQACRQFDDYNHHILDDPRVHIFTADGRNHLALTSRQYDVVISEPSNPWIAGIGDLFTREFFTLCRQRLTQRGIACIWLETYGVDLDSFRSVVNTFYSVFPNMTLWSTTPADVLMVGSKGPLAIDYSLLKERIAREKIAADLARIGIRSVPDFLGHLMMGPDAARQLAEGTRIHTDDNALLEFAAPEFLVRNIDESVMINALIEHRDADLSMVTSRDPNDPALRAMEEKATRSIHAKGHLLRSRAHTRAGRHVEAIEELRKAAQLNRSDAWLKEFLREGLNNAMQLVAQRQYTQAVEMFRQLLSIEPDLVVALNKLALLQVSHPQPARRDPREAVQLAERTCELTDYRNAEYVHTLSIAYGASGRVAEAAASARRALKLAEASGNQVLARTLRGKLERFRQQQMMRAPATR